MHQKAKGKFRTRVEHGARPRRVVTCLRDVVFISQRFRSCSCCSRAVARRGQQQIGIAQREPHVNHRSDYKENQRKRNGQFD
jgi:hypothetical protein